MRLYLALALVLRQLLLLNGSSGTCFRPWLRLLLCSECTAGGDPLLHGHANFEMSRTRVELVSRPVLFHDDTIARRQHEALETTQPQSTPEDEPPTPNTKWY